MTSEQITALIRAAEGMLPRAYAPYSHFHVRTALLCTDGTVFTGCKVENASYPAGSCAEQTVISKAVSEGKKDFAAICIAGGPNGVIQDYCPPCGMCLQVMSEFCDSASFRIILARSPVEYRMYTLKELLPLGFGGSLLMANHRKLIPVK